MKHLFKILFLLLFAFYAKAQYLYLQENYKGGICMDGRGYSGFAFTLGDSIVFNNTVPVGSTLKKAFIITEHHLVYPNPPGDNPINLLFNNKPVIIDSTNIITSYNCNNGKLDLEVKDVTSYALFSNNKLIVPDQSNDHYNYVGFLLLLLYENNSMPTTNAVMFLNNTQTPNNPKTFSLAGINPINTTNDAGLSIWVNDILTAGDSIGFTLTSSLNYFHLGDLYPNTTGVYNSDAKLPGSFYYQNNTLFGLSNDINSPFIDSTDAICNIKNYVANNTKNFILTTNNSISCGTHAFILAYSSPCPIAGVDTTKTVNVCAGQNVQINATAGYSTYTWSPATGLSSSTSANPVANLSTGANKYICYVSDAQGCMHTEHFVVNSYATPTVGVSSNPAVCGGNTGVAAIHANSGNFVSYTYTYTLNGITQSNNIYDLPAGTYSYTVTNNYGCNPGPQTFTIAEVNNAVAAFSAAPDTGCAPENVVFTNTSTGTNAQVWYINGDSITNNLNPNYTFTDSGTYSITLLSWYNQRACSSTVTHTVSLRDCPPPPVLPPDSISISVPNVFSPNADGINDSWQVKIYSYGYTLSNYQCSIYDRWGIKVFDASSAASAWDGRTTSGESASAGTYFYIIKLSETNSKAVSTNKEFKGFLELVR